MFQKRNVPEEKICKLKEISRLPFTAGGRANGGCAVDAGAGTRKSLFRNRGDTIHKLLLQLSDRQILTRLHSFYPLSPCVVNSRLTCIHLFCFIQCLFLLLRQRLIISVIRPLQFLHDATQFVPLLLTNVLQALT